MWLKEIVIVEHWNAFVGLDFDASMYGVIAVVDPELDLFGAWVPKIRTNQRW